LRKRKKGKVRKDHCGETLDQRKKLKHKIGRERKKHDKVDFHRRVEVLSGAKIHKNELGALNTSRRK